MYEKQGMRRRDFLRLSAMLAAGALAAACAGPTAEIIEKEVPVEREVIKTVVVEKEVPVEKVVTATPLPGKYQEAPMLAALVQQGSLPPVDERLPVNPLVWDQPDVLVFEKEEGKYGGTVKCGSSTLPVAQATIGLGRVSADWTTYYPDIAESWEWSPDATQLTFHLRKGMRWSDGEPFTANDLEWYFREIIHSKYLESPAGLSGMNTRTDSIAAVDAYTLRYVFAIPNPLYIEQSYAFACGENSSWGRMAPHYVKRFHPDYNRDPAYSDPKAQFQEKVLDASGFSRSCEDPSRPVIWPFRPLEYKEGQLNRLERNPYYHAVDRWGKQLPYLDYLESLELTGTDQEVIKLKLIAGETNWERRVCTVADVPMLRQREEEGNYDVILTTMNIGSVQGIRINPAHSDPKMAQLIGQADFRRALSIAINRDVINQTAYLGLGKVGHGFSEMGVYVPEIDGKWAEYDPDKASKMLDSIGLSKRDSEGFRTFPDGSSLTFVLYFQAGWLQGATELAEVAVEGWNAVGIRAVAKDQRNSNTGILLRDGTVEAWIKPSVGGDRLRDLKYGTGTNVFAPRQAEWWSARDKPVGERPGVKPEGSVLELFELDEKFLTTLDQEERDQAWQRRKEVLADQMWVLGSVQGVPHVVVASKNLQGVWGRSDEMIFVLNAGDEQFWPQSWYFSD